MEYYVPMLWALELCGVSTGTGSASRSFFGDFLLAGIRFGFRTGFVPGLVPLVSSRWNMKSAGEHPTVIDNHLSTEVASYRVAGPFPFPRLQCSPFGVIPKKLQPGKWHLILDLSSPEDHSVNAGVIGISPPVISPSSGRNH